MLCFGFYNVDYYGLVLCQFEQEPSDFNWPLGLFSHNSGGISIFSHSLGRIESSSRIMSILPASASSFQPGAV